MDIVKSLKYKGLSIIIHRDEDAESPAEWDNKECFLCSDYRFLNVDSESISAEQCRDAISKNKWFLNGFYIFPVSIYDHSGIALHLGSCHGWDYSNKRAFVCVKRQKGWSWSKSKAEKIAKSVLDEWNMYLRDEVYNYLIKDENGDTIGTCCGFYGDDGIEEAIDDAKGIIDAEIEDRERKKHEAYLEQLQKHVAKRKMQILHHVPLYARTAFMFNY